MISRNFIVGLSLLHIVVSLADAVDYKINQTDVEPSMQESNKTLALNSCITNKRCWSTCLIGNILD